MCANTGAGVRLLHLHLHHWNLSPSNSHVREVRQLTSQLWPESRNRGLTAMPFHVKMHSATLRRPRASGVLSSAQETRIVADEHVAHQGVSGLFQRHQTPLEAHHLSRWSPRGDEEDSFPVTVSLTHARHQTADNKRSFTELKPLFQTKAQIVE